MFEFWLSSLQTYASDSMFLFIDFVRVTNCFYDYEYDLFVYNTSFYIKVENGALLCDVTWSLVSYGK